MTQDQILEMEQKFNARNKPLPAKMPHKEEQEFSNRAIIQVLKEYEQKYKDSILKHHHVFSKNNQDIGKAEHFEHNILLKDNKPWFQKQYPIPDAHRPEAEAQIQDRLKMGIIQLST